MILTVFGIEQTWAVALEAVIGYGKNRNFASKAISALSTLSNGELSASLWLRPIQRIIE